MTNPKSEVSIRDFRTGDAAAFWKLNEEWITRYFVLEPKDRSSLLHPQASILDPGGKILIACRDGEAVGCCALLAMGEGEFEVAKMAVTQSAQGEGIRVLVTAGRLYQSLGFRNVAPDRVKTSPYARADVYMELWLNHEAESGR